MIILMRANHLYFKLIATAIGLDRLCWHNFENSRQLKELRIMLE